jgi:hypothetical protein
VSITKAREVDDKGNVSYRVLRDGKHVGTAHKVSGGYKPELVTGGMGPAMALAKAVDYLAAYSLPVDGDPEAECREFARQYPTDNVRRAIAVAESGLFTWAEIAGLFRGALAAGMAEVTGA